MMLTSDELKAMAEWVEYRACGPCRQTGQTTHAGCETALRIASFLRRLERFEGLQTDGTPVAGWLEDDS
jgi:hypothetical protein